ncbi:hypothetical protein KC340_g41 [Hortaea werneckii]|nr:hypothetical protein KC340_g41 [Hortaea werneckii]
MVIIAALNCGLVRLLSKSVHAVDEGKLSERRGPEVALMPGAAFTARIGGGSAMTGILSSKSWRACGSTDFGSTAGLLGIPGVPLGVDAVGLPFADPLSCCAAAAEDAGSSFSPVVVRCAGLESVTAKSQCQCFRTKLHLVPTCRCCDRCFKGRGLHCICSAIHSSGVSCSCRSAPKRLVRLVTELLGAIISSRPSCYVRIRRVWRIYIASLRCHIWSFRLDAGIKGLRLGHTRILGRLLHCCLVWPCCIRNLRCLRLRSLVLNRAGLLLSWLLFLLLSKHPLERPFQRVHSVAEQSSLQPMSGENEVSRRDTCGLPLTRVLRRTSYVTQASPFQ